MRLFVYPSNVWLVLLLSSLTLDGEMFSLALEDTMCSLILEDTTSAVLSENTKPPMTQEEVANIFSRLSTAITGETYLFVGEDLRLTCSLYDDLLKSYSSSNISFQFSQPLLSSGVERCFQKTSIQMVNTTAAMLTIHNVTREDEGQYNCYAGGSDCQGQSLSLVGLLDVRIEYPVQNVTNFQCVVYNFDESMECTWTNPVTYIRAADIEVKSFYFLDGKENYTSCPAPSSTGCRWDEDDFAFAVYYTIRVDVTNKPRNTTASKTFTCHTYTSVKPAPVEDLTATASINASGCLQLSWSHPRNHRAKVYRIQHQLVGDVNFTVVIDNLPSTSFTACGYPPYTHYNFSVDCFPSSVYSGYWSDPVYVDAWTPMTAPDLGPRTTNGSFTRSLTRCNHGLGNVTIMWQEVELSKRNGIIDGYIIKSGKKQLKFLETADVYSATVELLCDSYSTVTILARNNGGLSLKPSVLLIPPTSFSVSAEVNVEIMTDPNSGGQNQSFQVSWQVIEGPTNRSYTVFWCEKQEEQVCKMKSEIEWSQVPATQTSYNISLPSSDAEEYLFGISITDTEKGISSEIIWADCLFRRNPAYLPPVKTMDVQSFVESVSISWDKAICLSEYKVRYTNYMIKWCQTASCNRPGEVSNVTVPATESSYTVSSLSANVNYSFTVQPVSYEVVGHDYSPWKSALPTAADSTLPVGAALGGLSSGVLVLAVVFLVYRKCSSRRRKLKIMVDAGFLDIDSANQQCPNLPSPAVISTQPEQQSQHITTTTPLSQCQADQAQKTAGPREVNRNQGQNNLPWKETIKSRPHRNNGTRFLDCSTGSANIHGGPSSVKQSSQGMGHHGLPETGQLETFTSDYVQQNVVSHSDVTYQHELPQTTFKIQMIENNELLNKEQNLTNFSNKSENHFRVELLPNGYSRLMENQDTVKGDACLQYQSNNQADEETASVGAESVQSCCNHADCWLDQFVDVQPHPISLSITRPSGLSTYPVLLTSALHPVVLQANVPIGNTERNAETDTRDYASMTTVDLGGYHSATEAAVLDIHNTVTETKPTTFCALEPISEASSAERTASAEISGVNELSSLESGVSSSRQNTNGYISHISQMMASNGDTSSGQYGSSYLNSNTDSDIIPHNCDYIQLGDLLSTNTDSSEESLSHSNIKDIHESHPHINDT